MHSNSSEPSTVRATKAAEKLLGFYPKVMASDPQIFITGLVELLQCYPQFVIDRLPSVKEGLPAIFKFCPTIQEIKETCDGWVDRQREHDRIMLEYKREADRPEKVPVRSRVKENATTAALCERFQISAIPAGWDAITVTQQAHIHGSNFPAFVERVLKSPQSKVPPSLPQQIVKRAREAMERRLGEQNDDRTEGQTDAVLS
jgi:hypothetical protein